MIKKFMAIMLIGVSVYAQEIGDILPKFKAVSTTIITVVQNKQYTADVRNNIIIETISPMFDFTLMGKLSLGRKWKTLDKDTQKEFVKLYVKRMKQSYSSKIDKYTDEKIIVNSIKQVKKTRVVLDTSIVSSGDKLELIYKYYKPKKQIKDKNLWLVYDVVIDGVSIIKTDKAQFKAVIKESSIEGLMKKLRK